MHYRTQFFFFLGLLVIIRPHDNNGFVKLAASGLWRGHPVFSDETTFTIKSATLRKGARRKEGERHRTVNKIPTFKSGYQSISVWVVFSVYEHTPLGRVEGNLRQLKYVSVLQYRLLPFAETYHGGTEFITFMQDGCGPNQAKSVLSFLEAKGVELLP